MYSDKKKGRMRSNRVNVVISVMSRKTEIGLWRNTGDS